MELYNKLSREEAIKRLNEEPFSRKTVSFYRYFKIEDPQAFRDNVFIRWNILDCLGRVYVSHEGINAQMSVPERNSEYFIKDLNTIPGLENIPLKWAIEDDGKSFYKLTIKVRPKIVADGLEDDSYDVTNVGKHLDALEFHKLVNEGDSIVIDMRNHYESEVGKFKNAWCPDADTFRDAIKIVSQEFKEQKEKKILLYCTGGIRCEKASAYLKHQGFKDVNQLYGGIIEYAQQIKKLNLESLFTGKNFVFDQRLGESVNGEIISRCHQCGNLCNTHTNCANDDCHLLFIQCKDCKVKHEGCCSVDCARINGLPEEEKLVFRKLRHEKYSNSKIFKSRLRPHLMREEKVNELIEK